MINKKDILILFLGAVIIIFSFFMIYINMLDVDKQRNQIKHISSIIENKIATKPKPSKNINNNTFYVFNKNISSVFDEIKNIDANQSKIVYVLEHNGTITIDNFINTINIDTQSEAQLIENIQKLNYIQKQLIKKFSEKNGIPEYIIENVLKKSSFNDSNSTIKKN